MFKYKNIDRELVEFVSITQSNALLIKILKLKAIFQFPTKSEGQLILI